MEVKDYKPRFELHVNGAVLDSNLTNNTASLEITDDAGFENDTLTLSLDDSADMLPIPPAGAKIKVYIGYEENLTYFGSYTYDEATVELVPRKLSLTAKAVNMTSAIKSNRTKSHVDLTFNDIVETVGKAWELATDVWDDIGKRKLGYVEQDNESDLNFLQRMARREHVSIKVVDDTLVAQPFADKRPDTPIIEIDPLRIHTASIKLKARPDSVSTNALYHDNDTGQDVVVNEDADDNAYTHRHTFANKEEAQRAADALAEKTSRETAELTLTMDGNAEIRADKKIKITGVSNKFDGEYITKNVRHTFNESGFTTEITAKQTKQLREDSSNNETFDSSNNGDGETPAWLALILGWFTNWV